MFNVKRIHALLVSFSLTGVMLWGLLATPAGSQSPAPGRDLFQHLQNGRRLHWLVNDQPGRFVAPDNNWSGSGSVFTGTYSATQALALRSCPVTLFRTSVQDEIGQDIAWETAEVEHLINDMWRGHINLRLVDETTLTSTIPLCGVLVLPSFKIGYTAEVVEALGSEGLATLAQFAANGGTIYAQGQGLALVEAAGLIPAGSVDLDNPLQLPSSAEDLGYLEATDPLSPLTFNWLTNQLLVLDDPRLILTDSLNLVASYSNTIGGPAPAVVTAEVGAGRLVLVAGHATSRLYPDQTTLFLNALLWGMAEKAEYYGQAQQTYTTTVPGDIIPAYEPVTISTTHTLNPTWDTAVLSDVLVTERVQLGFNVVVTSIVPTPTSVMVEVTDGVTETVITWAIPSHQAEPITFSYEAVSDIDTLQEGEVLFSTGEVQYWDGLRLVTWPHKPHYLFGAMAANLKTYHNHEPDRWFTIPAEGIYLDEHIALENTENSLACQTSAVHYVPLIAPIVSLEDQREPLAQNSGQTVWMWNELYGYEGYELPVGMNSYTETWSLNNMWDGTTFVTMTTPGGYHIDPIPEAVVMDGFFVTIPPTYTHAITVTAQGQLLLPALRVEWDLDCIPAFWYMLPAVRYGIHSRELFSRPVSFTGDPIVGTVVVDATGGSVYTGAGADHLMYREFLPSASMIVFTPPAPADAGLHYRDIWGRPHSTQLRGNFYDVFNFASCACGDGSTGERDTALNITFGIKVDLDGDGTKETLLTDLEQLKGIMPTRLDGDLDILIKSINEGDTIQIDENVLEMGLFRGLGFTIRPRFGDSWADSFTSTSSTVISETRVGAYEFVYFQQEIPPNSTNLITIHATLDPTRKPFEGLTQIHQGGRLVSRQNFAGEGQYEVHDTHVQAVQGQRTDVELSGQALPSLISTYSDTVFIHYGLDDLYDSRTFNQNPYLISYGYGDAVATVYVGGRDKRDLLHSIVRAGGRTWVRVELNNNTGQEWQNVQVELTPPAGISVTRLFVGDVPIELWPDRPALNTNTIGDARSGLYFFELQIGENITDLLGTVQELPIMFTADNAPTNFTIPPAVLAIRSANGSVPRYTSGTSTNLRLADVVPDYVSPQEVRLANDEQLDELLDLINADLAVTPNTETANDYFQTLPHIMPLTTTVTGELDLALPLVELPWFDEGTASALHVVILADVEVTRTARYPLNSGATFSSQDEFGMSWPLTGTQFFVEAVGASVQTSYEVDGILHVESGEVHTYLLPNSWNLVTVTVQTENEGSDIAADTIEFISVTGQFTLTQSPAGVTSTVGGLLWSVGDLAPGARRTIQVSYLVYVDNPTPDQRTLTPYGLLTMFTQTEADFLNVYAGKQIQAQVGGSLQLLVAAPSGFLAYRAWLPLLAYQVDFYTSRPDLTITDLQVTSSGVVVVVKNIGDTAVTDSFWVDVYVNPATPPTAPNQLWHNTGSTAGLVWGVDGLTLASGQELTLTMSSPYYRPEDSSFEVLNSGDVLYAQVDSAHAGTTYGNIWEEDEATEAEYNNISGAWVMD